jgi:hypothetical protein
VAALCAALSAPCCGDAPQDPGSGAAGDAGECLGSRWPERAVIDPDAPAYSDSTHDAALVTAWFEDAKHADSPAYQAYSSAHRKPELLGCAFCPCGCAAAAAHRSAVDCFKDLHGFTCGTCQHIALRTAALLAQQLSEAEVRRILQQEFPAP